MFAVDVYTPNYVVVDTQRLEVRPVSYSAAAVGGPVEATIELRGDRLACYAALEWLRYYVVIRNPRGTAVWSGLVTGVEYQAEAARVGVTLDDMRNRILVDYTYDDADGVPQSESTTWLQDDVSVARYGIREERVSLADAPQTQAEQKRATWLAQVKLPVASIEPGEGEVSATLKCSGLWGTLDWQYYANDNGRVVYEESDNAEHILGWGLTSNTIGFREDSIHDNMARLGNLAAGTRIVVSGSASNNGTLTIGQVSDDARIVYGPVATITFEPADDVFDSASGFGSFRAEEMLRIEGSASNNGYYWVKTTGTHRMEVTGGPHPIIADWGSAITLSMGHKMTVESSLTLERPAANVTLTALGTSIAQSFVVTGTDNWAAFEVLIRAKRIGNPGDNLRVVLATNNAGNPGTQVAYGQVAGSSLMEDMDWVTVTLVVPPTLTVGATYWVVVDRTGTQAHDGCYAIGFNTDADTAYGSGAMKIWNGSAWATRWEDGDMPFQIWGQELTSTQLTRMLQNEGQFFSAVSVLASSGVYKRQYRDGTRRALAEVEELMETGTSGTRRYVATVTPARACIVRTEPYPAADDPVFSVATGEWRLPQGGAWEEGVLPAGRWVAVGDLPPLAGLTLSSLSPFFCERADYDVESGRLTPEPRGRELPWDV